MEVELRELGRALSPTYPVIGAICGWIPFVIAILLSFVFSALYIRYFWKKHETDRLSAITAAVGLWIALLTSLLLPVDVFLISFMKNSNGTFKDWATNETRTHIENSITYTYYTFYALILFFAFFLLPLVYFAYEEKDDEFDSMTQRLCAGLRYTSVFFLFAVVLILVGAFIPYKELTKADTNSTRENMTDWEKFEATIGDLYSNKGEDALTFIVNVLTVIGMAALAVYTGLGLSSFPIESLRGWQSLSAEREILQDKRASLQSRIAAIKAKAETGGLSSRDMHTLSDLEDEYELVRHMEIEVNYASVSWWQKLKPFKRILDVVLGILGMGLGLLLWASLLLVNIDRTMNSFGYEKGYLIKTLTVFNPLSYVMVQSQKVFPVDYILYCAIVVFLIMCTIAGIRYLGIRCLCIKIYKIRPYRTEPQGLIILCMILMYTVLAINILMYETIPQYTTFGSQHYTEYNATTKTTHVVPCDNLAPEGECLMTRASAFVTLYAIKASFFAMVYFWMSWIFLAIVILGFFIVIMSKKRSIMEEAVDPDDFDEDDTDGRLLIP